MYPFSNGKYIRHEEFHAAVKDFNFKTELLCSSFMQHDVYAYHWGNGEKRLLIWSQMHGNESSGTFAIWHVMQALHEAKFEALKEHLRICFVPIVNPDGAEAYTRFNAQGIDLNRDARSKSSNEMRAFFELVEGFKPDWAFNLHDQRSIFNVKGSAKPATIALLSPAYDAERSLNATRVDVMKLIAGFLPELQEAIPGHISRFSDEFYPRAVGDVLQAMGIRCMLLESGAYPKENFRHKAIAMNVLILSKSFELIAHDKYQNQDIDAYFAIPENAQDLYDRIIRNAQYKGIQCDIAFLIKEELNASNELVSSLIVADLGDLSDSYAYAEIDWQGEPLVASLERNSEPEFENKALLQQLLHG